MSEWNPAYKMHDDQQVKISVAYDLVPIQSKGFPEAQSFSCFHWDA